MSKKHKLNLPKTDFGMRPSDQSFSDTEELWGEQEVYDLSLNKDGESFILHDGPPYANGNIHIGHALNKVLKDAILKRKRMQGYNAPFVPGWDTHGLPIELKASEEATDSSGSSVRAACRKYARKWVDEQERQFQSLGIHADWDHRYETLDEEYKREQLRVFNEMFRNGYVYRGKRPVYWSPSSETALAEAELEYKDVTAKAVYVELETTARVKLVIWTTTPWTLPANRAVAYGKDVPYVLLTLDDGRSYVLARALYTEFVDKLEIDSYRTKPFTDFEGLEYYHPFSNELCPVVVGHHVTDSMGTGLVHIAPGHGEDDYWIGQEHGLGSDCILDERGHYNDLAGVYAGDFYMKADKRVRASLNAVLYEEDFTHSYPHDWRTKKPIVFRVTNQWFVKVEDTLEVMALASLKEVEFYPPHGRDKMIGMILGRPDWCISRQRAWGVPIPVFYHDGQPLYNQRIFARLLEVFEEYGTEVWFTWSPRELLGERLSLGLEYDLRGNPLVDSLKKETDIMDVWFDSGVSHRAVGKSNADLYLEGHDQYRGWFQTSLLTAVASDSELPYKAVVTHGFVVDGKGRKMSKSLGNVVSPDDVVSRYNKDVLRLWTVSVDYKTDVRISDEILNQVNENYRRLRNTFRFFLGNLSDFNFETDSVALEDMHEVDRYMLHELEELKVRFNQAYDEYDFYGAYRDLMDFIRQKLSAFYLDITKDRLYVERSDSVARRSVQTVFCYYLQDMVRMIAPVCSYLSEEVWAEMDTFGSMFLGDSVFQAGWAEAEDTHLDAALVPRWNAIFEMREVVNKEVEKARANGVLNKSLEADVTLYLPVNDPPCEIEKAVYSKHVDLTEAFIVSGINVWGGASHEFSVKVGRHQGEKCDKCWRYSDLSDGTCKRCLSTLDG